MSRDDEKWAPVVEEAQKAFARFQDNFGNIAGQSPNWRILTNGAGPGSKFVTAEYVESPEHAASTGHQLVRLSANINASNTTGYLILAGHEAWEFKLAEAVGTKVAGIITPILQESGLRPTSEKSGVEGRSSSWFNEWKLWPANHPKFIK